MSIRGLNKFKDLSSMDFHDMYWETELQVIYLFGTLMIIWDKLLWFTQMIGVKFPLHNPHPTDVFWLNSNLTHWSLVTPYGGMDLGQHCLW